MRALVMLLVPLAALTSPGCGYGDTLPREDAARRLDSLCGALVGQARSLPPFGSSGFEPELRRLARSMAAVNREGRRMEVSREYAAVIAPLLANLDRRARVVRVAADALRRGDQTALESAGRSLSNLTRDARPLQNGTGVKLCAERLLGADQ